MLIKVFGPGCARCEETHNLVIRALEESGCQGNVEKVTDFKEMMASGVMATPAVAIDGKVLCTGRVPSRKEVLEWIKGACAEPGCCVNPG